MVSDLNKMMTDTLKMGSTVQKNLKSFLLMYDGFFREANALLIQERLATADPEELNDFSRLVGMIKRNRDVVGSLNKIFSGLRDVTAFKFIEDEENIPIKKPVKPKKAEIKEVMTTPTT